MLGEDKVTPDSELRGSNSFLVVLRDGGGMEAYVMLLVIWGQLRANLNCGLSPSPDGSGLFFVLLLWGLTSSAQGFLLALYSGIIFSGLRGLYRMPGLEPRSTMCNANAFTSVLSL